MEFCEVCDNMLYLKTEENGDLVRYCKSCAFTKTTTGTGRAIRVSKTLYSENDMLFVQNQNQWLRYDPTLPRVADKELVCPSATCTGPIDDPQCLYVKYNPIQMLYFYCCDYCGHCWRKNE